LPRIESSAGGKSPRKWSVRVGSSTIAVALDTATHARDAPVFIMAHGAGGHMDDRGMTALAALFRDCGLHVVRFNFPYREAGSRRPDPMPVLQASIAAVAASVAAEIDAPRPIIGGRSMGGRAASMLAAEGFACDRVLLLAYPLHPAGEPGKTRDAHLARIRVPVLCFNGTRDPLCRQDLMSAVVARLPDTFAMRWLDGADHSFHVLKSSGRTDADVVGEIAATTREWLSSR
jgi:predicted alpha/beta-hydrolase family hydrolase